MHEQILVIVFAGRLDQLVVCLPVSHWVLCSRPGRWGLGCTAVLIIIHDVYSVVVTPCLSETRCGKYNIDSSVYPLIVSYLQWLDQ